MDITMDLMEVATTHILLHPPVHIIMAVLMVVMAILDIHTNTQSEDMDGEKELRPLKLIMI